jgi:hypothetical protein
MKLELGKRHCGIVISVTVDPERNDLDLYRAECDQIRWFVHGILSACRAGDGLRRSSPRNGRRGTGMLFANG